jgi:hypothetical protein
VRVGTGGVERWPPAGGDWESGSQSGSRAGSGLRVPGFSTRNTHKNFGFYDSQPEENMGNAGSGFLGSDPGFSGSGNG